MNKVILSGRIGRSPKFKTVSDKFEVANFTIATNRYSVGKKDYVTDWHNVAVYNPNDYIKTLKPGDLIEMEGYLKVNSKEKNVYVTVVAENLRMLKRKEK